MANQVDLTFPDTAYSSSEKPSTDVMKTDLTNIESTHNALDDDALYVDGTKPMTGALAMGDNKITGLAAPTDDNDAARKVDGNPVGTILEYAGPTAPSGYLMCDGAEKSRATYAALFALVGEIYGAGDGSSTFLLPDKQNRTSFGAGDEYTLGEYVGAKTINLYHRHTGPNHRHSGPSHRHSQQHRHSFSANTGNIALTGVIANSYDTQSSQQGHYHTVSGTTGYVDTTYTGYEGTGVTGYEGTGNTSYGLSSTQSITNRGLVSNFIIKY